MQDQKNAFEDAFNINPKGIPQIKLNHNGTIFVDKNGYDWKVGFTNKNMTIFCDKCLKLTPRTLYCKPVKDRIIRLQQASHSSKRKTPAPPSLPPPSAHTRGPTARSPHIQEGAPGESAFARRLRCGPGGGRLTTSLLSHPPNPPPPK